MARLSACFIVLLMSLLVAFLSLSVEAKVKHINHGRPNFSDWVDKYHPESQKYVFRVHRKKTAKKVSEDKEPIPQPTRTKEMRDLYGMHHNTLGMWKGGLGQHRGI